MPDNMKAFFEWCMEHWGVVLFVISAFVEFTPAIKLNPIKAVLKWVGKVANGDVLLQLAALTKRSDEQRRSIDENEMDRIRWEVLAFANACRNNIRHTKDEFQHIITLNAKYHALLDTYKIDNGVFDEEYAYILNLYHKCQVENDFL